MVWIKATYRFTNLFSYRIPDFSSQYAAPSLLPGPSTIKLAIVATAIESTGNINYGKEIFEIIKNTEIRIKLPKKVCVSSLLVRRLRGRKKPTKESSKGKGICQMCGKETELFLDSDDGKMKCKNCWGFERTFGVRGYVYYPEKLSIYLDAPESKIKDIERILKNIRRFGTSDSLAWCEKVINEEPPSDAIFCVERLSGEYNKNVLIIPIKDINPGAKFDDLNPYSKKSKNGKNVLLKRVYAIPISNRSEGRNWIVYELL